MAVQKDLDAHYTTLDKIFRLSIGEIGAYSGARYDGDFSMKLEDAQRRKHEFIWKNCNIKPGQADACIKNGLKVKFMDSKQVNEQTFGTKFDTVTAMGSPEHLCSVEQYRDGKQNEIYKTYFKQLSDLIPVGGRIYIQTMVFGKNIMPIEQIPFGKVDIYKKHHTDAEMMAMLCDVFPGSWLPYGSEQVIETAKPHFKLLHIDSGRLDYIETIHQWTKKFMQFNFQKYLLFASLAPSYVTSSAFRAWMRRFKVAPNLVTFEREILEHYRMVYEKVE